MTRKLELVKLISAYGFPGSCPQSNVLSKEVARHKILRHTTRRRKPFLDNIACAFGKSIQMKKNCSVVIIISSKFYHLGMISVDRVDIALTGFPRPCMRRRSKIDQQVRLTGSAPNTVILQIVQQTSCRTKGVRGLPSGQLVSFSFHKTKLPQNP